VHAIFGNRVRTQWVASTAGLVMPCPVFFKTF